MEQIVGTDLNEILEGTQQEDVILGKGGDDIITGAAGDDLLVGDYALNLLQGTDDALTFDAYAETGAWTVTKHADGHTEMSQVVETVKGASYDLSFDVAANFGGGSPTGAIEVLWNDAVIGTYTADSGVFETMDVSFEGTGEPGVLSFRSVEPETTGPQIDTSGPIWSYQKTVEIGGQDIEVAAIAEGQPNLYQVLNGTLMVFDPATSSYEKAGADASVVVNAIGFNQEDDLIYGVAVKDGKDSLGNKVSTSDLVMLDAEGNSYLIGETPYRSWTGDFDDKGNLWAFEADMDYFMAVDVSERDANGNPVVTKYNLPDELITARVWDVAFDASTQTFQGVIRPKSEGETAQLISIDISGSEPVFTFTDVVSTEVDGTVLDGVPAITFGAAITDADGTLYVGGNGGDHDMNDGTASAGGFYRVVMDEASGTASLVLMADAPKAYSNDGAADPRALDPFTPADVETAVLIKGITMSQDPSGGASFDDQVNGQAGADELYGNQGEDILTGASGGDELHGGTQDDALYGGAGPDAANTAIISVYDDDGNRFDQFGNALLADDDFLFGEEGEDYLNGSAGHDRLDGGSGNDVLEGGSGHDTLYGGEGDDLLEGGRENDVLFGGEGKDTLLGGSGDDLVEGGQGDDVLKGNSGDDTLDGGLGADDIRGDAGADILSGGSGKDKLNGGSGDDRLDGGTGNDYLNGSSGDDHLVGGEGKDRLYLGSGDDIAEGGAGADRFVFRNEDLDGSTDRIVDFQLSGSDADLLDLRQLNIGMQADAWISQSANFVNGTGLVLDLSGSTLILEDIGGYGSDMAIMLEDTLLL